MKVLHTIRNSLNHSKRSYWWSMRHTQGEKLFPVLLTAAAKKLVLIYCHCKLPKFTLSLAANLHIICKYFKWEDPYTNKSKFGTYPRLHWINLELTFTWKRNIHYSTKIKKLIFIQMQQPQQCKKRQKHTFRDKG